MIRGTVRKQLMLSLIFVTLLLEPYRGSCEEILIHRRIRQTEQTRSVSGKTQRHAISIRSKKSKKRRAIDSVPHDKRGHYQHAKRFVSV